MPDAVKQTFINALRATPEGIADFLLAEIPEPPEISTPADVDAAIIANGVCAKYVLDLFRPFAGLTIVALLLRIGQHNSVMEGLLLAGLEYLKESQAAQDFAILSPEGGRVYYTGALRVTARALNETKITRMTATSGEDSVNMTATNGIWQASLVLTDARQYTVTVQALCPTGDPLEKSVTVMIEPKPAEEDEPLPAEEDEPLPAEGDDADALQAAFDQVEQGYATLMKSVEQWTPGTDLKDVVIVNYQAWKAQIVTYLHVAEAFSKSASVVQNTSAALYNQYFPKAAEAIYTGPTEDTWKTMLAIITPIRYLQKVITSL